MISFYTAKVVRSYLLHWSRESICENTSSTASPNIPFHFSFSVCLIPKSTLFSITSLTAFDINNCRWMRVYWKTSVMQSTTKTALQQRSEREVRIVAEKAVRLKCLGDLHQEILLTDNRGSYSQLSTSFAPSHDLSNVVTFTFILCVHPIFLSMTMNHRISLIKSVESEETEASSANIKFSFSPVGGFNSHNNFPSS